MITLSNGHKPSPTNKIEQFNKKMLRLAQELVVEELLAGTILACGQNTTSKLTGSYGRYETFNGEVVTFQPQFNLNFTLICNEFVVTTHLLMIRTIIQQVEDDYELVVSES